MFDFRELLRTLTAHEVDFIIVGGLAGVIQGAPIHTKDLDVLYALTGSNPERLLGALGELHAVFRDDPGNVRPTLSHLRSPGHKLLSTTHGDLDRLGTVEEETTYEDLATHIDRVEIGGTGVQVITLQRLIEVKRKLGRPKDQLALLQREATLSERLKSRA